SSRGEAYIDAIDWAAMLMADPECVIVNKQSKINTWPKIVEDARKKNGNQLWVGPANGGLDHVTALKIWGKAGMKARWIPFKSGGKAIAALLGEQGLAYVGNPRDILGNDDLKIAVVSSEKRLPEFPDVPTFSEFGIENMSNEYMWRGLVYKKGTPQKIQEWYDELFQKVTDDQEWQRYWKRGAIDVTYKKTDEFTKIVQEDKEEFTHYLQKLGIIQAENDSLIVKLTSGRLMRMILIVLTALFILVSLFINRTSLRKMAGEILIPILFILISLLFLLLSFTFPSLEEVSSAVVPRLWIFILIPLNIIVLIKSLRKKEEIKYSSSNVKMVYNFICLLILYLLAMHYIGYFISTFLFVTTAILLLGYRKYIVLLMISVGWLLFSYFVFYRLLYVPLPLGKLIELL
ncbi:MAG: tripartite tricarboxylate transporter substrate-binding protein, partial [Candidatus Cloacimonadota bacterium]|nr:tripartite tricarboxylate transporter substrate-binding protein [Candidatus Cloacimonadota bacterium]